MEGFQSAPESASTPKVMTLNAFIDNFGEGLLDNIEKAHPPRYTSDNPLRRTYLSSLKRAPFAAQAEAIQAICTTLSDDHAPAGIINGEMGTGKTLMGIAARRWRTTPQRHHSLQFRHPDPLLRQNRF